VAESTGRVRLALTRVKALHRAETVLAQLHARITSSDPSVGVIEASLPMGSRSWGRDRIIVRVSGDDGDVVLDVKSRTRTTLFGLMDLGKSADNVRRFITAPEFDESVIEATY